MMLSMARRIPFADFTMKDGRWEKKTITGVEVVEPNLEAVFLHLTGKALRD